MNGIEMLLKSFGLNPKEIQDSVKQFGDLIIDLKNQQNRIEAKLDLLLEQKGLSTDVECFQIENQPQEELTNA